MESGINRIIWVLWLSLVFLLPGFALGEIGQGTLGPISGRPVSVDGIIPADALARMVLMGKEIEEIRYEMGKPKASKWKPVATNAQPHEVYFQALTLFVKADRLALEMTGSTGITPAGVPASDIRPFHVWELVNAAYERIGIVKRELGIAEKFSENPQVPETSFTEVGRVIVQTNRQLNVLLERRFSPSDVFQQVTLGIRYAASLLAQFPNVGEGPKPALFERGKQPTEVFLRLVECYSHLETIAQESQIKVLHLNPEMAHKAVKDIEIQPSDIYDIATLLVSDLAYLHAQMKDATSPGSVPYPGRKFPAHVFQQSGLLLDLLIQLEQQVKAHPHWLDS